MAAQTFSLLVARGQHVLLASHAAAFIFKIKALNNVAGPVG